jgi:hypothetical protein
MLRSNKRITGLKTPGWRFGFEDSKVSRIKGLKSLKG